MLEEDVGLTVTYNRLKDVACDDTQILALRKLHEELDRRVLAAYADNDPEGHWNEIDVPPFCPMNEAENKQLEKFENEVIDRLFALNAKRAEEEQLRGLGAAGKKAAKKPTATSAKEEEKEKAPKEAPAAAKKKLSKVRKNAAQLQLAGDATAEEPDEG
jgi:hypothetical protein